MKTRCGAAQELVKEARSSMWCHSRLNGIRRETHYRKHDLAAHRYFESDGNKVEMVTKFHRQS
jgi:hypothetical protein